MIEITSSLWCSLLPGIVTACLVLAESNILQRVQNYAPTSSIVEFRNQKEELKRREEETSVGGGWWMSTPSCRCQSFLGWMNVQQFSSSSGDHCEAIGKA